VEGVLMLSKMHDKKIKKQYNFIIYLEIIKLSILAKLRC
jgi:hypothetical protein